MPISTLLLLPLLCAPAPGPNVAESFLAPVPDRVDELLALGRQHLADGRTGDALLAFTEAEQLDAGSLRTRVFVLRAKLAQGTIEDVLLEVDDLKRAQPGALEFDYLYGIGFHAMAEREVASGQTTAVTGSVFEDAVRHLKLVTAKDEARFGDAWATLAACTWYTREFELGKQAAEKAIALAPADPWKQLLRGRLALAAYTTWMADAAKAGEAEAEWRAAVAAFLKAAELCGSEPEARLLPAAQQALVQLGTAHLWKQDKEAAAVAYRRAIALDPATADYGTISGALSGEEFLPVLEGAHKDWTAKHGTGAESGAGDAPLLWWIGYARYGAKSLAGAEQAFELALAKNPKFTNCLYYLYRIRYEQREFAKSLEALHRYDRASTPGREPESAPPVDPDGLTNALAYDLSGNTARLEGLIGWAMEPDNHAGKKLNLEAAFACELITKIVAREPENSRHWNNLGLFLRDESDDLRGTQGALEPAPKPYDEALVNRLWTDSLAAYETALELEPRNPNYLNDTAVMLHYYFVRDLERAKQLYQQGFEEATALLKRTDLSPETREAVKTALRDTGNNVRLVQKLIDKRAAEAAGKLDKPAGG